MLVQPFQFISEEVPRKARYGNRKFSSRTDYEQYFLAKGMIQKAEELWKNSELLVEVQRHWHKGGQNGCVFAQHIARRATNYGWIHHVVEESAQRIEQEDIREDIAARIEQAIADPECQLISFLFPEVTNTSGLMCLIRALMNVRNIDVEALEEYNEFQTIRLRVDVTGTGVMSWLMTFAPFEFYPNTRQAPVTELVIRVKPQPEEFFEMNSYTPDTAHIADTPFEMEREQSLKTWDATFKNTKEVLGKKPDLISAAKTTFSVPLDVWTEVKRVDSTR